MNAQSPRSVLVTGAGGDIGAAAALRFAGEGARIAVVDRKLSMLDGIIAACRERGAAAVLGLAIDQTERDAVETQISQAADEHGGIDVLFANAGYGRFSSLLDQPLNEWQRHIDVNLTGTFHVCQVTARRMVQQRRGGAIVINASSGATQYSDLLGAYCIAKAGLGMLVKGMASELGCHRIRVNGVLPGVIQTGMTAPMLDNSNEQVEGLLRATPVGRLGRPEDVGDVVHFLTSPAAGFITGHCMAIDGGQTLHGHPQWYSTDYRNEHESEWKIGT